MAEASPVGDDTDLDQGGSVVRLVCDEDQRRCTTELYRNCTGHGGDEERDGVVHKSTVLYSGLYSHLYGV